MSFYLTLISDNSINAFPQNKPSDFTTILDKELKLDETYLVSLVEIQYSEFKVDLGFLIVKEEDLTLKIPIVVDHNLDLNSFLKFLNYKIIEEYYKIVQKANLYENSFDNFKLLMEYYKNRLPNFSIYEKDFIYLAIPDKFSVAFEGKLKDLLSNKAISPIYFQKIQTIENLFVYSNILQDQLVGDSSCTLLRIVNLKDKSISPHYVPLRRTQISTINIEIKDELGRSINFNSKVILKLHIKNEL